MSSLATVKIDSYSCMDVALGLAHEQSGRRWMCISCKPSHTEDMLPIYTQMFRLMGVACSWLAFFIRFVLHISRFSMICSATADLALSEGPMIWIEENSCFPFGRSVLAITRLRRCSSPPFKFEISQTNDLRRIFTFNDIGIKKLHNLARCNKKTIIIKKTIKIPCSIEGSLW